MKTLLITAWTMCLVLQASGQESSKENKDDAIGRLASSTANDLEQSLRDLNQLREQIASEKLPVAQQLTALEEKVAELRRQHDQVTRSVDEGTLQLSRIKGDIKFKQDELDYVGNLLDEFARSFETRINVSEQQYLAEAIQSAKEAVEGGTVTPTERFDRELKVVDLSLKRVGELIGGMTFPGVAVDPQGTVADGKFTIIGPVALFMAQTGTAGLVVPQAGSNKPLVRPLEGTMQAGIVSLLQKGDGLLPLDPSLGGALKALVQKTSLIHVFEKGGPIMWPLLVAAILSLGTVLERVFFLMRERLKRDDRAQEAFFAAVQRGDIAEAIRISTTTKFFVVRAMGYALAHKETSLASALLYSQAQELKRFQRGIPILDTVITLAPLLGLLGTVTGMMGSFSLIGGELSAPGAITGGIAEALIATAFGLGIAIVSLLPFNFLNARTDEARHELESAAAQLELLVQPSLVSAKAERVQSSHSSRDSGNGSQPEVSDGLRRKRLEIRKMIAELQTELEDGQEAFAPRREHSIKE